jgi:hypothetical protein
MLKLLRSWKTTLAGLIGLGCIVVPAVAPQYAPICLKVAAAATAAGLVVAKDGDKSSEQVGVKPPADSRLV